MYKNMIDLYFEIEKILGDDKKAESEAMKKVIEQIGGKREKIEPAEPFLADSLKEIMEKINLLGKEKLKQELKLEEHTIQAYRFVLNLLKKELGKDLEETIHERRRLQIEEIAKKYI